MKKIILLVALLAMLSHAYLIDLGLGPAWSFYTFDMPKGNSVQSGSDSYLQDFEYTDFPNIEILGRIGMNPHDDFGTSGCDFNLFGEYAYHRNHVNYEYGSTSGYMTSYRDIGSDIMFHDVGIGFGGSLPHASVNLSFGYEYASAYGGGDGGLYMRVGLGGYISSSDKTSYRGMLIEMDCVLSSHRFSVSLIFGVHLNGIKDYTEEEIAAKEKEEETWLLVGTGAFAATAAVGSASASKGGGGGYSGTCRYGCRCNDGTMSYAEHRQGACSWHGGISPYSN